MLTLPPEFIEATNGILVIVLLIMIGFLINYLIYKYRCVGHIAFWYDECKAALALLLFLIGYEVINSTIWWLRHTANNGHDVTQHRTTVMTIITVGVVASIWGGMCWVRAITPFEISRKMWIALFGLAVGLGTVMVFL